jgi:beta-glucanase (GH16 family)
MYSMAFTQTLPKNKNWELKWEDNFDNFDDTKWIKADTVIHGNEPQLYLKDQVWTSDGNLVIELNNIPIQCPNPPPPANAGSKCLADTIYKYRSGLIETTKDYNVQFGYIEARIKFPYKEGRQWGFFPAFWTFKGRGTNPTNAAEIDICEIFGGKQDNSHTFETNIHRVYDGKNPYKKVHRIRNFNYSDWHTYAIEWDAKKIVWYLDGKAIRKFHRHQIVDPVRITLNLAIESGSQYHPPTSPYFEEYMYVDYVKIYELKNE